MDKILSFLSGMICACENERMAKGLEGLRDSLIQYRQEESIRMQELMQKDGKKNEQTGKTRNS